MGNVGVEREFSTVGSQNLKKAGVRKGSEIGGDRDVVRVGWTEDSPDLSMGEMKWPCEI